jgi:hypothetical protein
MTAKRFHFLKQPIFLSCDNKNSGKRKIREEATGQPFYTREGNKQTNIGAAKERIKINADGWDSVSSPAY